MTRPLTILLIAVAIMGGYLIRMAFPGKTVKTEKMIRNEVLLEVSERDRLKDSVAWSKRELWYDSTLNDFSNRIQELETRKIPIYNAIKTTKYTVDNYDREQLRRAFTNPE